jgi:hypothetical protein
MRHVICALLSFALFLPLRAAPKPVAREADVTVILIFKSAYSHSAILEMENESARILDAAHYRIGWHIGAETSGQTFNDLAVMKFAGSCRFDNGPPPIHSGFGVYGKARVVDGAVQPFGEIDCDRVVGVVRSALVGGDYVRADMLVGRVLGRVVAHELLHILTRSVQHSREGVNKSSLTVKELTGSSLPLSPEDADRLLVDGDD